MLTLKPSKCVLVLTCFVASAFNIESLREWLCEACLAWQHMKICNAAKYLGFYLGPMATPLQWTKALDKFQSRVGIINSGHAPAHIVRFLYATRALPTLGYLAQLLDPPKNIITIGLHSVIKVLRMAGNSLSYRTAFSLETLGGPNLTDISVYLKSCLIRSACKTVTGHEELQCKLLLASIESLSFARHRYKHAIPPGWDAPAFCTTLGGASQLLPQEISGRQNGPSNTTSLQSKILKSLIIGKDISDLAWRRLLGDRISNMCSDDFDDESHVLSNGELQAVCGVLMKLSPGPRMCVIKTLVNSWTTSCRMGEDIDLPCFFCGEDMEDDLCHYLECDTFWTLLVMSANLKLRAKSFLSLSPTHRIGLLNPSVIGFKLLAGAFLVYHGLKFSHISEVKSALASGDLGPIHELTYKLAEIQYCELIEDCDLT